MPSRKHLYSVAPHATRYERGYALLLLYEPSADRVKPRAVPHSRPKADALSKPSFAPTKCSLQMPRIGRAQRKYLQSNLPLHRLPRLQHHHAGVFVLRPLVSKRIVIVGLRLNRNIRSIQRRIHSYRLDVRRHRRDAQAIIILRIAQLRHWPAFQQASPEVNKAVVKVERSKLGPGAAGKVILGLLDRQKLPLRLPRTAS